MNSSTYWARWANEKKNEINDLFPMDVRNCSQTHTHTLTAATTANCTKIHAYMYEWQRNNEIRTNQQFGYIALRLRGCQFTFRPINQNLIHFVDGARCQCCCTIHTQNDKSTYRKSECDVCDWYQNTSETEEKTNGWRNKQSNSKQSGSENQIQSGMRTTTTTKKNATKGLMQSDYIIVSITCTHTSVPVAVVDS